MTKKTHPNRGSTLNAFLDKEGVREAFEAQAIKEVIARQLTQAMEEKNFPKIA